MVIATCWLVLISVAYASVTLYMVDRLAEIKENAAIRHRARLDPTMVEVGRTPPEQAATNMGIEPKWRKVKAGMYVDRVSEFSTRDSRWGLDFYIWFVWSGDGIEPGETFHIIEGEITDKRLQARHDDGGEHYALYRVGAKITKNFSTARFPRDDHLLTIRIEDATHYNFDLEYIPDAEGSELSSRAKITGYEPYSVKLVAKDHSYKTPRGDLRLPPSYKATYSQLVFGIGIE